MVDIEHDPLKKIVVHELYPYKNKEGLMRRAVRPNTVLPLYWCGGMLFMFFPLDSSTARKEYIKGIFHLQMVAYCTMPEYKNILELEDEQFKGVKIPVTDLSGFEIFEDLTKWLKKKK
ncbi:MAG: hypothetical protein ABSD68_03670 [Candidatus Micrarchaeales archaeon]|jgi:hypothetical protein